MKLQEKIKTNTTIFGLETRIDITSLLATEQIRYR